MNKLLNPNGGMPLFGDDLVFVDAAVRDALKGMLYEFAAANNGNLILGGCVVSVAGSVATISSGYVMAGHEVYYFAGKSWAVSSGLNGSFVVQNTIDAAGVRTFANGTSQSPWQTRLVDFTPGVLTGGALDLSELKRFSQAVYEGMGVYLTSSTAFTMLAGWAKAAAPNDPVLRKHFGQVMLTGDLVVGTITNNTWTKITTLPVGYRPVKRVKSVAMAYSSAPENGVVFIDFLPNGEVYVQDSGPIGWDLVSINLSFWV